MPKYLNSYKHIPSDFLSIRFFIYLVFVLIFANSGLEKRAMEQAVIENVSLKQQFFADIEKYCPPHCILASNTSTIDLNLIGEKT